MTFYHNDSDNNDDLTEEEIKKIKEEKLKELAKDQEEYIQKQYYKGVILDYSKKSNNIFNGNGNGKGTTKSTSKEDKKKKTNIKIQNKKLLFINILKWVKANYMKQ